MPPLVQMVYWKSLRLISGTPLWTWNARESFLPPAGTMSELLMGMQGRSWCRPWWGIPGVVCASQGSWGDKWGENGLLVGEKLTLGLFCKRILKTPTPTFVVSSSSVMQNHVIETPHRSLDPQVPDLSLNAEELTPSSLGSCEDNSLTQYFLVCQWEVKEWSSPHCCQAPIGHSWISWLWQAYRVGY